MSSKKWVISLMISLLTVMLLMGSLMFYLDPLLRYRKESGPLTYYTYTEIYSNPGIARHYDYDSVMVGTSMIENTNVDLCDKLLGTHMVRLPYSGGTSYNMKRILEICFDSHPDLKSVYWELDEFQLTNSTTEPRYPLPEYLYAKSHYQDLSYLLNLDIFYHYTVKNILGTLRGDKQEAARRGQQLGGDYNKQQTLNAYARLKAPVELSQDREKRIKEKLTANLENIIGLVSQHPNTCFYFFVPPFSILYWDNEIRNGQFDVTMDCIEEAVSTLLSYENVRVYFYHDEKEIITDLDNYKDYSHYGYWINDLLTEYISQGRRELTKENYREIISEFRQYIHEYDFDALYS